MSIDRPEAVHAREFEWGELTGFAASAAPGTRFGVLCGRRRQGKTMLLQALAEATSGFYWQARQQSAQQNLTSLSAALTAFRSTGVPTRLANWEEAVDTLCGLSHPGSDGDGVVPVLVDEFGYLLVAVPGLASMLQAALSPLGRARRHGRARLVACGSALGQMRMLLDADSPLRGRADLELVVRPFDYRDAAAFWGLGANPDAAFRLHALVGGTPAYRDYTAGDLPADGDIDGWVVRHLLNPASPLFREGRIVVAEDAALSDQALYWGVLGAVADGLARRGDITAALGRPATSLGHALTTLTDAGWIDARVDPLRSKRTTFRLAEPIVRCHRLVVEPNEARLTLRRAGAEAWSEAAPLVASRIYGPHLEDLACQWVQTWAAPGTVGGEPALVGPSEVSLGGVRRQVDLVVVETTPRGGRRVLAVGEVKSEAEPVGPATLETVDAVADHLQGDQGSAVRRLLFARGAFTGPLRRLARARGDVELVDLHRLYHGV